MSLPPRPDLQQLRKQAKELLRALKSGDAGALKRFQEHLPDGWLSAGHEGSGEGPTLADANAFWRASMGSPSGPG